MSWWRKVSAISCCPAPSDRSCPGRRLAGLVYTLSGRRHEDIEPHVTYLAWTGLLGSVPSDHVLVCQPNDDELAHMGELSAETLQLKGVLGYVVDGGCRDVEFIQQRSFPVFCRYVTPTDIVARWMPEGAGEPIKIGGIALATGDYVLADDDGIVVLPANTADAIVAATETRHGKREQSARRDPWRHGPAGRLPGTP